MKTTSVRPSTHVVDGYSTTDAATHATQWHAYSIHDVFQYLGSSEAGLDAVQVARRLERYGRNELVERGTKRPWQILWEQLTAVMVLILLAAAGLSLVLGKVGEASAILGIVILFVLLGFVQEYRAERAIAALKRLTVPTVRVRRAGTLCDISSHELVPGDLVLLEAGNLVPADLRLTESVNLRIQEAALTGESAPIDKITDPVSGTDVALGDQRNMAFMGTQVIYGRGAGVVVATGMTTELGRIANLIQDVPHKLTPLQQRLDTVGKQLAVAGVTVALLMLVIGLIAGEPLANMLLTAISVAVAVIPEGLPAVVTFTLALGAQRMLKRNALIRKLPAVETLGSVTVICSDKTGTLTENRMRVTVIDVAGERFDTNQLADIREPAAQLSISRQLLLVAGTLCNDATLDRKQDGTPAQVLGDPTEGALLLIAERAQISQTALQRALPRIAELPFDSERKRMTTIHKRAALPDAALPPVADLLDRVSDERTPYIAFTKGAIDGLLDISAFVWDGIQIVPLTDAWQQRIVHANEQLARDGMRVLGLAFRPLANPQAHAQTERDLVLIGIVGIVDPPRAEVRDAVATCRQAGIRPVMITGDHPLTASYIARQLGISRDEQVVTGVDLNTLTDEQLDAQVEQVAVYARVAPQHKQRIVAALRRRGHVVAMTGDGVNDAPALKQADIGVAMGITGTDVSKQAADMVLRDDNFATIVAAVEEGRVIYDNLRRFVSFAVAGNIGKVGVMLLWPLPFVLLGRPLTAVIALLPLQLLWLNLMTDGLLGLSIGAEPAERNVMQRPPHMPTSGIFSGGMGIRTIWVGGLIAILGLGVGFWYYQAGLAQWQTMIFTAMTFLQVFQVLATRSHRESLLRVGIFSNRLMWLCIGVIMALHLTLLSVPLLRSILHLVPLTAIDLALCFGVGALLFVAIESTKWVERRRAH